MGQLNQLWSRLTWAQRIWIGVAAAAVIGGLSYLNHWNQERDFKPLFSGLAPEDAGTITSKLRELGVEYRLASDGAEVLVPSEKVAETRLQLASAGLPKSGRIGFELFDKTNFGASDFAEQVNYHRAIEGELERSVMSIREVEQARVHITLAKDSLYTEQRQPAKASVLVKLRHASALSPQNIAAICQLTASAVPGLSVDQVTLVDTAGNLLNRPRAAASADGELGSEAAADYRKSVEHDVQNKIGQTLEPLLGPDHFRVGVSADVDLTSGDQSEEIYDPQKSVIATSQTTQDGPALASASGVPGTPSNLPNPVSKPSTQASNYARHTENTTYQTSRVVKHTRIPQGRVKKLSISVLVDHLLRQEGSQRVVEAPSAEKLKVIHDLVTAAAGIDTQRGDQLVVESFPFEATLAASREQELAPEAAPGAKPGSPSPLPPWAQNLAVQQKFILLAAIGAAALLALGGLFAAMWLRNRRKKTVTVEASSKALEPAAGATAVSADDVEKQIQARIAEQTAEKVRQEAEALLQLKLPSVSTKKTDVLVKHIAAEAKKDPTAMAHVVRTWMHGDNQR